MWTLQNTDCTQMNIIMQWSTHITSMNTKYIQILMLLFMMNTYLYALIVNSIRTNQLNQYSSYSSTPSGNNHEDKTLQLMFEIVYICVKQLLYYQCNLLINYRSRTVERPTLLCTTNTRDLGQLLCLSVTLEYFSK